MRESRNPFRLRRAENIDTDTEFLALFEPGILDVLSDDGLPSTVQSIRSAAGGGKTSLLRLFTPSVLRRLHARRVDERDFVDRLRRLGVIDETGPRLLGVSLLCGRNYAVLEDLPLDDGSRRRLFLSLLNARVILAVLRSALALRGLGYPENLGRVQVAGRECEGVPDGVTCPCSGEVLNAWAKEVESTICAELDSFGPMRAISLPPHDDLFALSLIRPEGLTVDGKTLADRIVIMMDDIHMLTSGQRSFLVERVIEARSSVGIWIAERFEALSAQELLAAGSQEGRDHDPTIEVEWYWRRRHERFEKHVMRIADRRVRASLETELDLFRSCLEDNLNGPEYESIFERAEREVSGRIREKIGEKSQFDGWYESRSGFEGSARDRAIRWRALEIVIERVQRRPQKELFDDAPRTDQELEEHEDAPILGAAELFLAREFDLPYYYGADRIARLASLNIEQFLGLGAPIFEEVIAGELMRDGTQLFVGATPARPNEEGGAGVLYRNTESGSAWSGGTRLCGFSGSVERLVYLSANGSE